MKLVVCLGHKVLRSTPIGIGVVLEGYMKLMIKGRPISYIGAKTMGGLILTGSKRLYVKGRPIALHLGKLTNGVTLEGSFNINSI